MNEGSNPSINMGWHVHGLHLPPHMNLRLVPIQIRLAIGHQKARAGTSCGARGDTANPVSPDALRPCFT